jgi:hypothetical protein
MSKSIEKQVAAMQRMSVAELRAEYAGAFGEPTRAGNRAWLVKRVAWRLQADAEGDLPERARRRAAELANDADLRLTAPKGPVAPPAVGEARERLAVMDRRLPPAGTVLERPYKKAVLKVTVRPDGFEYEGAVYRSLSAVAKAATGMHCNGFAFFGLAGKGNAR